jgi:hypothetical protein
MHCAVDSRPQGSQNIDEAELKALPSVIEPAKARGIVSRSHVLCEFRLAFFGQQHGFGLRLGSKDGIAQGCRRFNC